MLCVAQPCVCGGFTKKRSVIRVKMGISGLLQFIKDAAEPVNVKKYKGQTVAVDTYCWLHKGAFSCAEKLAKGEPTDQYVWYCMKFVDMLLNFSVKPILVFDGRNLPSKQEVEKARRQRREANLQRGKQLLREGKPSEARDCFSRCVNITPAMAHNLIKAARTRGVDCVVAPYEADAQLAYLNKCGLAQAVITEDSDLLAFGCKTVILKMDKHGNGLEIDQSNLGRCRSLGNVFTEEKFRHMCILSGCDYLPSLHGIGLGKACKLLRLARDPDILKVIRKMGQYLKMNLVIPDEYMEGFVKANNTFLYQLVFDPVSRKVVPLNPYPKHLDPSTLSYAGLNLDDDRGLDLALGNLDINTMERIDDFNPDEPTPQLCKARSNSWNQPPASAGTSIWSRRFTLASAAPLHPAQQPPSTRRQERVISLDRLKLQAKRPREDSCLSDQEVLQQYSTSELKRSRPDQQPDRSSSSAQTRPRNRFATLLQRRNQEVEEHGGQATRSRFFRSSNQGVEPASEDRSSPRRQIHDSSGPEIPSVDAPSPPVSPTSTPPSSASQGLKLFQWSCSSGLSTLQQFQYKKEGFPSSQNVLRPSGQLSSSQSSSPEIKSEDKDNLSDSPPSEEGTFISQSLSQSSFTSCQKEALNSSFPLTGPEDAAPEMNSTSDLEPEPESPVCPAEADGKPGMLGSKVSGLSRLKSSSRIQTAKIQSLGPARASGLRKRSSGSGKKYSSTNNENNPGFQATISSLWKNYSFKKDTQKMTSCKKGEPMSPVKDNLLIS
nr:LOW QUALITY PROTEIN: exonuclease 1 [Nothobranchius furzeri]